MSVYSGKGSLSGSSIGAYKLEPDYERGPSRTSQNHTYYVADFDDPNLSPDEICDLEEDSPYPEVRSAVANTDDPDMPVSTIRTWVIGILGAILIPGMNQFFFFRYPSILVGTLVAQLVSYPLGRLAASVTPRWTILGVQLNPGPFTIKEHVLITIMAGVGSMSAYATDIIAVQRVFYGQNWSFAYQWMVVMSTQIIGYSFGGILRRFLVDPPSMIWPANLVSCALFNTLHSQNYAGIGTRGGISRERFFLLAFIGSTVWYFFPGYLFTALSWFSWVCWIAPNNVQVNQMFGYVSGMGMSLITFDWAQIAYIGSPLATPFWAAANVAFGFVFFFWLLTPILYYTNVWYAAYLPILARETFDNTGASYNVTAVLNPDSTFNQTLFENYSPLFLPTTFAITYGLGFASITATVVHTLLYYRRQIWVQAGRSLKEQPDIHARLMSVYALVPNWWYIVMFVAMFVFGIISIEVWPTQMPVWAFVLALLISFAYVIPVGMIQAITNQQVGLNVITELIIGYALPGKPIAMMMFKTWGYVTMSQALQFSSDFKLGHYMKIPPRVMFLSQVVATVVAGTVQLGVQAWMFDNIPGMCTTNQVFSCPSTEVFGSASIIWGVIGPSRLFNPGQLFYGLTYFFLVGAIVPVIPWLFSLRYPNSWWKYVNFPVIFSGTANIPPATAVNYVTWAITGFIFNWFIRRRHFSWWAKYNYVLSAALDSGVAISSILIFFALQYPLNGTIGQYNILAWWGNTVWQKNADANYAAFLPVPDSGTFGPAPGTWH